MFNKRTDRILLDYKDLPSQEDVKPFIAIVSALAVIVIVTIFVHLTF